MCSTTILLYKPLRNSIFTRALPTTYQTMGGGEKKVKIEDEDGGANCLILLGIT